MPKAKRVDMIYAFKAGNSVVVAMGKRINEHIDVDIGDAFDVFINKGKNEIILRKV